MLCQDSCPANLQPKQFSSCVLIGILFQSSRSTLKFPAQRGFYEKVTDVNISPLFTLRWGLSFSSRLRRMLFSTVFLYALCMSLRLCAGWGPMEKSMLPVIGRPR
jgi:hypothetical protein